MLQNSSIALGTGRKIERKYDVQFTLCVQGVTLLR